MYVEHEVEGKVERPEALERLSELVSFEEVKSDPGLERLSKLGFKSVVKKAGRLVRMKTAYSDYLFVTPSHINDFNEKLKKETLREDKRAFHYKKLVFIPLEKYEAIPDVNSLNALEVAQKRGIFDSFGVVKIEWKEEIKDPIIFGRIDGCEDYFFISQWDDDVKVEELIFGK
jgi:hypothetical protein